jgi:hypothetical protein
MGQANECNGALLTAVPAAAPKPRSWRRRWGRRLLVVAVVLGGLYLGRAPLLRTAARLLIVDEPPWPTSCALVMGGDRSGERAIQLYKDGAVTEFLMIPWRPRRLQRLGVAPSAADVMRGFLRDAGLAGQSLTVLAPGIRTDYERAHRLRAWLEQHPDARVTALCHAFDSRKLRWIFDRVLGPEYAPRVRLRALRHRWYDETDWWQNMDGVRDVLNAGLGLGHFWLVGECDEEWHEWDPDEYEKTLR